MQTGTRTPPDAHTAAHRMLAGRVALVTGASAGIGAEFARFFAEHGARVALVARRADRLHALAEELRGTHGAQTSVIVADMAHPGVSERILAECTRELGPPDILVNNAGYGPRDGIVGGRWQDHADFIQVMMTSYVELSSRAAQGMRERGYGRIIQVSSLAGFAPEQSGSLYGPAKRFITSFSKALALELQGTGVHACASCPGFTHTEFHDVMGNRSRMDRLPPWMWITSRQVVTESWKAVDAGRPVVVVGALNKFIAFVCQALPAWAVHAISPKAVTERRAPTAAMLALCALLACIGACAPQKAAPALHAGAATQPATAQSTARAQPLHDDLPLIYLNIAAEVARCENLSAPEDPAGCPPLAASAGRAVSSACGMRRVNEAIAELGRVLPRVKADCEAGVAIDWPATRAELLAIGTQLGGGFGMQSPTSSRNSGVFLPPGARVTWQMRATPALVGRGTGGAYRIADGGSVRLDLGVHAVEYAVTGGSLVVEGFDDAAGGERVASLERAQFSLRTPGGATIDIALAPGSPSHAVFLKADHTGLVTGAFTLRSSDPVLQQYFDMFGMTRLTMDFVLRDGQLDFAAAGAMPALIVAPSELPLAPGMNTCAALQGAAGAAAAVAAAPRSAAWSQAQLDVLQVYCALRGGEAAGR